MQKESLRTFQWAHKFLYFLSRVFFCCIIFGFVFALAGRISWIMVAIFMLSYLIVSLQDYKLYHLGMLQGHTLNNQMSNTNAAFSIRNSGWLTDAPKVMLSLSSQKGAITLYVEDDTTQGNALIEMYAKTCNNITGLEVIDCRRTDNMAATTNL